MTRFTPSWQLQPSDRREIARIARERLNAGANKDPEGDQDLWETECMGVIGEWTLAQYVGEWPERWVNAGRYGEYYDLRLGGNTLQIKCTTTHPPRLIVLPKRLFSDFYYLVKIFPGGYVRIEGYATQAEVRNAPLKKGCASARNRSHIIPAKELHSVERRPGWDSRSNPIEKKLLNH